jgi:hypothetical protein
MNLANVREGDIVEINKRGRLFYARVQGKENHGLKLKPITSNTTYYDATAREVVGHWSRRKR